MTKAKCVVFAGLLGCTLGTSACTGDEAGLGDAGQGEATVLLNQAGAIERLGPGLRR